MRAEGSSAERRGGLARFLALYAALYGAYGVLSPVLPGFLAARGLTPGETVGQILCRSISEIRR